MTARASKACSDPKCPNLQPCPVHEQKPWEGSKRREKTISGWAQQRRARMIMAKYGGICHVCGQPGADEIDHVDPLEEGGADTVENLRPIHSKPCHEEKTAEEARRGKPSSRP